MEKQLIATDFDGTFFRNGVVSAADRAAVAAFRAAGGLFGFVTGRGWDFLTTAKELGLEADFFLIYNGALLATPDGTVKKEYLIPRDAFNRLAVFFRSLPDVCAFDKEDEGDLHQYYARFPDAARALSAAAAVDRRFGGEVTAFVNGCHVNIGKKGGSKTQGVFDALDYYSLPPSAAAVFGDDYNDLDMIVTHNGWAVANAREAVLQKAPHVCGSVGEAALSFLE